MARLNGQKDPKCEIMHLWQKSDGEGQTEDSMWCLRHFVQKAVHFIKAWWSLQRLHHRTFVMLISLRFLGQWKT